MVIRDELDDIYELRPQLNGTFGEALRIIMNKYGYTQQFLEKETTISRKTISKYLSGEIIPPLKSVLAICSAMRINSVLTNILINKAGYVLGQSGQYIDFVYMFLINECYKEGLDSWNKRLIEFGMEIQLP